MPSTMFYVGVCCCFCSFGCEVPLDRRIRSDTYPIGGLVRRAPSRLLPSLWRLTAALEMRWRWYSGLLQLRQRGKSRSHRLSLRALGLSKDSCWTGRPAWGRTSYPQEKRERKQKLHTQDSINNGGSALPSNSKMLFSTDSSHHP